MLRGFTRALIPVVARSAPRFGRIVPNRTIQSSAVLLAKAKKNKKDKSSKKDDATETTVSAEDLINFSDVKSKFESIIEKFNKKATDVKMGKTNPNIFDKLDVKIDNNESIKFNNIAQTSVKGRNLTITVFDPDQVQSIINAILGSGLNMNPTFDKNLGTLKVPLPPVTTETKQESVKELKSVFESFKNNNSNSLNAVRTDYKQKLKKVKKMSDSDMKVVKDLENLHKEYLDKLSGIFKNTEKTILK